MDWYASGLPREGKRTAAPYVGDLARRDVPTCRLGDRLEVVQSRVREAGWDVCLVVDGGGIVLGLLSEKVLAGESSNPAATAGQVMEAGPSTFRPSLPVQEMTEYLREHKLDRALITTSDGKLVGILDRATAERPRSGGSAG